MPGTVAAIPDDRRPEIRSADSIDATAGPAVVTADEHIVGDCPVHEADHTLAAACRRYTSDCEHQREAEHRMGFRQQVQDCGGDTVRAFCRLQRQALLAEARTLQTLRRERNDDPGAAFTIEVAILRTNAELECVEAAEARAGQRLVDVPDAAEQAAESTSAPIPLRRAGRGRS